MRTVEVIFHREDGIWWAEAKEDGELYGASSSSLAELRSLVAEGLEFMLDEPVQVDERRADGPSLSWLSKPGVVEASRGDRIGRTTKRGWRGGRRGFVAQSNTMGMKPDTKKVGATA